MRAHLIMGMAATAAISSAAVAEISLDFTGFEATGANFALTNENAVAGNITDFAGDFVLDLDGENFTWADDLTVLIASADLSDILVQMGGFSDFGATYKYTWPVGAAGDAGTEAGGLVSTDVLGGIDATGYYVWIGNGYGSGGVGTWSGNIKINGTIDYVPAPGALALLGVAGLAGRRRRA